MSKKCLFVDISPGESNALVKILYDRLSSLDKHIENVCSRIEYAELLIPLDDEYGIRKINEARKRVEKLKTAHSVKLRFVRYMENAIEENDSVINFKIEITRNDEIDEVCKNCIQFNNETGDCNLIRWRKEKCLQTRKKK